MTKTITISINENDLLRIDTYCTLHNLTRSKALLSSLLEKVTLDELANGILTLDTLLARYNHDGVLSDADKSALEGICSSFSRMGALVGGNYGK